MKLSIIIPVYNCENYICRCLNSILEQRTTLNYEIIIVNDGSTDNTLEKIEKFKLNYGSKDNFTIIDKKNTGVSSTRNVGLEAATGNLVTFLDADDYIESNYFETIKNIFKSYPDIQLLGFGYYSIVENNNFITVSSDKIISEKFYIKNRDQLKKKLVKLWDDKMLYNIWNKVYLKSIIDKNNIKFYDENWGEDMDFNRKYLSVISNFYLSDEAFYNYVRERLGASTNRYRENFYDIRRNEFIEFNKYFRKNGIEYSEYIEFSSRRFVECVLGVIENLFSSNLNFRSKYQKIKKILNDKLLQTALKNTNSKTLKTKIMLIPLKIKNVLLTMLMGKFVNVIKNKMPGLFNHLKNNR